jgi:ABC-type nickel/cobalt efflux system permease component RcnA
MRQSPVVSSHKPAPPPVNLSVGSTPVEPLSLKANRQATPRSAFTELFAAKQLGVGIVATALALAVALGALHALEPGHGKTVVAAYLVGSRGTVKHAVALGLIVTASHTAGVYILGGVTFFASQYILPESLYPWIGVGSGLTVAALGIFLFVRRYRGPSVAEAHDHPHSHRHRHSHDAHLHAHHAFHQRSTNEETVSLRELSALGITGGIIPCPAALVVLLSALSLGRGGFGLLLIVAFSVGLAVVLVAIGILMVSARQLMFRFQGNGPVISRWLPLASSAVVTFLGIAIAVQALVAVTGC